MNKILISFSLVIFLYNTSFSQSDSVQWNRLIKKHKSFEVINDDYIDKFWTNLSSSPMIFLDTIIVLKSNELDVMPSPIEGMEKFSASIEYPEIARRAGLEGSVVLSSTIDTSGSLKNIESKLNNPEIFENPVVEALKRTKFIPAIRNGKPVEAQIAAAFSFILYRKKNIQIDSIIVEKDYCLGPCPVYKINLNKNGEIIYEGIYKVDKLGKWKSSLDKFEFEGLTSLIFATNFFGMKEKYSTGVTDLPWTTIKVVTPKLTKEVTTDYYLPIKELAKLVNYLIKDLNWEKVEE